MLEWSAKTVLWREKGQLHSSFRTFITAQLEKPARRSGLGDQSATIDLHVRSTFFDFESSTDAGNLVQEKVDKQLTDEVKEAFRQIVENPNLVCSCWHLEDFASTICLNVSFTSSVSCLTLNSAFAKS